ncbi:MAG: iron ABC transporter permease [Pseudomonadota bacterium]
MTVALASSLPRPGADDAVRWGVVAASVAGILALPTVAVVAVAASADGSAWRHLVSTVLGEYVWHSVLLALGVGTGTLVIGTTTAWLTTVCAFPGWRALSWLLLLPLALPAYIVAYTYTGVLDYPGPVQTALRDLFGWGPGDYWFPNIRSLPGAILVLTLCLYPYVYLLSRAAFVSRSASAIEVGRSLGLGPMAVFARIGLPLARPAVVTGVALVLMETLADYGTVKYFGVTTFTTGIFRTWFGMGDRAAAAQLATALLGLVLLLVLLERWSRRQRQFDDAGAAAAGTPYPLRGWRALAAAGWCALPLLLGFLVPALQLAWWCIDTFGEQWRRGFPELMGNSILAAGITAAIAVFLALLLGYGQRLRPVPTVRGAVRVAASGYAVPGTVIAVGVIIPLAWLDNSIDGLARELFGVSTGLLLSGTLVAVIFAYLVRFMSVGIQTMEAGLAAISTGVDDCARALGCAPKAVLGRVLLPLLRPSLLTAGLLVFVDVMKELPATLILRPFDFNTLAVRAYELAEDEQLAAAAPAALAIVIVGLVPVFLLARGITRERRHA